jgi:hypothetical protein
VQRFGDRPLPHPLVFELTNIKDRRITHCGVLEFSSDQSTAFLPKWMMLNMLLNEGDEISLKLKDLPTATALVLQPLKWTFTQIATPKIALEHALNTFTALTSGDRISIRINGKFHELSVIDVSPPTKQIGAKNAACVVNAHLEVDFLPPLEQEPESLQSVLLQLDEIKENEQAEKGTYRYYRVKTNDSNSAFQAEVNTRIGDPELVISTSTNKPDLGNCTWKSIGTGHSSSSNSSSSSSTSGSAAKSNGGGKRLITIGPQSLGYIVGWYYVGVYAYGCDAVYDIVLRETNPPNAAGIDGSSSIGGRAIPSGPSVGSLSSSDPNAKLCPNCQQYISQKSFSLHSAQCARMNIFCAQCNKPIRKSEQSIHAHCPIASCNIVLHPNELQKHVDLVHTSQPCPECGESIQPSHMIIHQKEECKLRPATCQYCHMEMAHRLVFEHQQSCGAQTIVSNNHNISQHCSHRL